MLDPKTLTQFNQFAAAIERDLSTALASGDALDPDVRDLLLLIRYQLGQVRLLSEERAQRKREILQLLEHITEALRRHEKTEAALYDEGTQQLGLLLGKLGVH